MSKTFYCCGRCGKFFNGISYGIIKSKHYKKEFNISFFSLIDIQEKVVEELEYEICPECWKSFKEWFEKRLNEVKK